VTRREFITLLGGTAVAWPLAARAQQPAMPVIGVLGGHTRAQWQPFLTAFHQGLKQVGYIEGENVASESKPMPPPLSASGAPGSALPSRASSRA
jgi:hypothetical protein